MPKHYRCLIISLDQLTFARCGIVANAIGANGARGTNRPEPASTVSLLSLQITYNELHGTVFVAPYVSTHLSSRNGRLSDTVHRHSLEDVVVDSLGGRAFTVKHWKLRREYLMVSVPRDCPSGIRIPDHHISIRSNCNASFLWVHVEYLRSRGAKMDKEIGERQ